MNKKFIVIILGILLVVSSCNTYFFSYVENPSSRYNLIRRSEVITEHLVNVDFAIQFQPSLMYPELNKSEITLINEGNHTDYSELDYYLREIFKAVGLHNPSVFYSVSGKFVLLKTDEPPVHYVNYYYDYINDLYKGWSGASKDDNWKEIKGYVMRRIYFEKNKKRVLILDSFIDTDPLISALYIIQGDYKNLREMSVNPVSMIFWNPADNESFISLAGLVKASIDPITDQIAKQLIDIK
ncbi:MAG: hypothetical protein FWD66_08405 [Paludibacter sp.]|nr:hypothetical protein [Paludibacter sp.]